MANRWEKEEQIVRTKFREKYEELFEDEEDLEKFIEYLIKPIRPSIRINTLKISVKECKERLEEKGLKLEKIPWVEYGFWVEGKEDLGNLEEHCLGYIYCQEAASMVPPLVMDLKEDLIVLDLCAAPGSKTTQISQIMNNTGIIVANDVDMGRVMILIANIQRMGCWNVIVTKFDGRRIHERIKLRFERILVDAPCSAEGAIRKSYSVLNTWSERNIINLSRLQRRLIESAYQLLEPGGILVYSTCTLDPRENELVVAHLLNKFEDAKLEKIHVEGLKIREGVTEWRDFRFPEEVKKCARIWPHDNDTEGFFIAKIRKNG